LGGGGGSVPGLKIIQNIGSRKYVWTIKGAIVFAENGKESIPVCMIREWQWTISISTSFGIFK
jgi:hypothetical protein